jgi:4-hydroxythreonine-4-phosphate dehydrogenase
MEPRLVVPQGDLGGIAPEVLLLALTKKSLRERCRPVILGHRQALEQVARHMGLDVSLQSVTDVEAAFAMGPEEALPVLELESALPAETIGQPSAAYGMASVEAVLRAGSLALEGRVDAIVTPPVHKESMHLAGYPYEGQTQIFGETCRSRRYGMLACAGDLRVLVATRHMSLRQALDRLEEPAFVAKQIRLAHEAARQTLGIEEPRIVMAGLNPHAGEGGAFGKEERGTLLKALRMAESDWDYRTTGPAVPDVVFREGYEGKWDVVIALYHDQAFIPLKMLPREESYTLFVGGPILRVSPVHGAAYDIARQGKADAAPFVFAMEQAIRLAHVAKEKGAASAEAAPKA